MLGERHPDYATSLNNLALLLDSQGDYAGARPLYEQALAIRKEVLGERHPLYATSLSNLASVLWRNGIIPEPHGSSSKPSRSPSATLTSPPPANPSASNWP